jgi:PTS system cellobiose-specific IIB component
MRILVVCGAGASSTFVALRLSRAARDAGLEWTATAGTTATALDRPDADLVLLGPHVADQLPAIAAASGSALDVLALPSDVFEDRDGAQTLAWVRSALDTAGHTLKGKS